MSGADQQAGNGREILASATRHKEEASASSKDFYFLSSLYLDSSMDPGKPCESCSERAMGKDVTLSTRSMSQDPSSNDDIASLALASCDGKASNRNFLTGKLKMTNFHAASFSSTRIRNLWQKVQRTLPQHAPLYAALFCSVVAITLSIRTQLSTRFVKLNEPLRISPFLKNVDYIGLSKWELCALKQEALDVLVGDDGTNGNGTTALTSMLLVSIFTTTTDIPRNVTSHILTNYHHVPHSINKSTGWMDEPDHDDILVSGDFPYNDDDAFESDLPVDYWACHHLQINSKSADHDKKLNIARMFFMMGSIMGTVSTILLITLIILRGQEDKQRQSHQREVTKDLKRKNSDEMQQQRSLAQDARPSILQNFQLLSAANNLLALDTDSSGYRPISICFLLAYLLQMLTLLFLDSQICRDQVCSIATGAHGLLAACVLWVVSGLLVLFMMKRIRKNEQRIRRFKRRVNNRALDERQRSTMSDGSEDVESLLHVASNDIGSKDELGEEESQGKDEECILNTTVDTECSEFSSLASPEED